MMFRKAHRFLFTIVLMLVTTFAMAQTQVVRRTTTSTTSTTTTAISKKRVANTPKPAVTTGTLKISSTPTDAAVKINGTFKGTTPLTLEQQSEGVYQVAISAEGYETQTDSVTIKSKEITSCSMVLVKKMSEQAYQQVSSLETETSIENTTATNGARLGIAGCDVASKAEMDKEEGKTIDYGTLDGVYIAEIVENGAAQKAGLQVGDIITYVNEQKILHFYELLNIIATKCPGDKVLITFLRNKEDWRSLATLQAEQANGAYLGIMGQDVAVKVEDDKEKGIYSDFGTLLGVYIAGIEDNGAAEKANLQVGDVITQINSQKIRVFGELAEEINHNKPGDKVLITFLRDKKQFTKEVTLQVRPDKE